MKDELLLEKQTIESNIKGFESTIENAKKQIHWQKKRLRLVEQHINSIEYGNKEPETTVAEVG